MAGVQAQTFAFWEIAKKITLVEFYKVIGLHISAYSLIKSRSSPPILSWKLSGNF